MMGRNPINHNVANATLCFKSHRGIESTRSRLIKSPKVYRGDSGLACYLLGIGSVAELERSPFLGALFEGFVASEILKSQINAGDRKEPYYFRDQQGLEVDFLLPRKNAELWLIEAKATITVRPDMAAPLISLSRSLRRKPKRMMVIHRKARRRLPAAPAGRGVEALDIEQFVSELTGTIFSGFPTKPFSEGMPSTRTCGDFILKFSLAHLDCVRRMRKLPRGISNNKVF